MGGVGGIGRSDEGGRGGLALRERGQRIGTAGCSPFSVFLGECCRRKVRIGDADISRICVMINMYLQSGSKLLSHHHFFSKSAISSK
jgi:hypothetical protein